MLNTRNALKALAVSVALAFLISVGSTVLFGSGITAGPELDWEKVNSMSYSEASNYINAHSKKMSGWEMLVAYLHWGVFITPAFFTLIGSLFVGCVALLWWVRGAKAT